MAKGQTTTITQVFVNNAKTPTTIASKTVQTVVIDNKVVADPKEINPGVNDNYQGNK